MNKKLITYWISTSVLSFGMLTGGVAQILHLAPNLEGVLLLGYPAYMMTILGAWKILGVLAILVPGRPLLKEWAYAGFIFEITGAIFSHLAVASNLSQIIAPSVFVLVVITSWSCRPASRRIQSFTSQQSNAKHKGIPT